MDNSILKIGIMGGTFDPVHNGHVEIAKKALFDFGLSKVIFVPSGNPPHKQSSSVADKKHRLKMVRLAVEGYEQFEVSSFEVDKDELSYTIETLRYFQDRYKGGVMYLIVGADNILQIPTWKDADKIMKACKLVIANRPGYRLTIDQGSILKCADILFVELVNFDVSSTDIRSKVRSGVDFSEFVPKDVHDYIIKNSLYL